MRLTVLRSGGTSGTAQLGWNATVAGYLANDDVTPSTGNVRFISGQSSQDIEIFVKADNIPEDNEVRVCIQDIKSVNSLLISIFLVVPIPFLMRDFFCLLQIENISFYFGHILMFI